MPDDKSEKELKTTYDPADVESKWYSFWDALTRQRTDGALVRLITPVADNETLQDAEARLQGFTKQMAPVLKEYIPE